MSFLTPYNKSLLKKFNYLQFFKNTQLLKDEIFFLISNNNQNIKKYAEKNLSCNSRRGFTTERSN